MYRQHDCLRHFCGVGHPQGVAVVWTRLRNGVLARSQECESVLVGFTKRCEEFAITRFREGGQKEPLLSPRACALHSGDVIQSLAPPQPYFSRFLPRAV